MARPVLGLDIGGANLKAAHSDGAAYLHPYELWKNPAGLAEALGELLKCPPPFDLLAVTMTGELCDCFETRRLGVQAILDAVEAVASPWTVCVWRNDRRLVELAAARESPLQIAAANWLALATFAGRYAPAGPALVVDIGSTTTDIVPLLDGQPVPRGRTDRERLTCHELVYTGVRRTPLCALLGTGVAAEWFATTLDVYLILGNLPEDSADRVTADHRPATRSAAHSRLAHMLCADSETCTEEEVSALARQACQRQVEAIGTALQRISEELPCPPRTVILAGSGEFLARMVLESLPALSSARGISLAEELGPDISQAACAYGLARLAGELALSEMSP